MGARPNAADVAFIDLRLHLQRVQVAQHDGPAAEQLLGSVHGLLLAIGGGAGRGSGAGARAAACSNELADADVDLGDGRVDG